ncbi:TIGR04282 family arsenosugar biosynthesis glycosyltransferase [Lyngbya confervoides]|uniref:TIGR04282 family arsenosugar biosynthesis glycosyltransferase n=1 Tax=Lyngbya confervoides BDU141951 TaxID=1574623 RepID=A0ABD4T017_9CYAN|nr:TIGR04282 family arsenosugar biosynthesis glycosyltransferase [Lyngbya confervoides]MCM1981904.1 TIGR04282 family arsenosugar biosynthesis glycosyltransferase [Lyngbya confervoides BDU141951]
MSDSRAILLFVKAPQPGQVKTRLGKRIGDNLACDLYRCFGLDLYQTLQAVQVPILVFYAPAHQAPQIRAWLTCDRLFYQGEGDLGQRMQRAFECGFALGYKQLLILGSDSPDVPLSMLQEAWRHLAQGRGVIGPSEDGGYYTLGFHRDGFRPEVFQNMTWSTPRVYQETLKRLKAASVPVHQLPVWFDVDTASDLSAFIQRNQGNPNVQLTLNLCAAHSLTPDTDFGPD